MRGLIDRVSVPIGILKIARDKAAMDCRWIEMDAGACCPGKCSARDDSRDFGGSETFAERVSIIL